MNRAPLLSLAFLAIPSLLTAQFAFNAQAGATFQQLTDVPPGVEAKAAVGAIVGVDFRMGDRFYFQPGAFFERNRTAVKVNGDTIWQDDLVRSSLKLKALVGYNIADGDGFRLRFNTGPTYDVLLSVDDKDDQIAWNKDDFNAGSFNWNAALGVDISFITVETGVTYGLSKVFKEQEGAFSADAKYLTFHLTAGVVFGGAGDK